MRPAGLSSDEDFSDDDFSFGEDSPKPRRRVSSTCVREVLPETPEKHLMDAVLDRNIPEIERLLMEGVDANCRPKGPKEWTPLLLACSLGDSQLIKVLLERGADPNLHSRLHTPIMALCNSANRDEVALMSGLDLLVAHNARLSDHDRYKVTALILATKRGHRKLVERLLSLGSNVNEADTDGWSSIFYAVDNGDLGMVQTLIDSEANISTLDGYGRSLFDIAMAKGFNDIAAIVLGDRGNEVMAEMIMNERNEDNNIKSNYDFVLSELPDKRAGRFSGFQNDTIRIIHGTKLGHLSVLFTDRNIHLGELLTNSDEDWKQAGVELSFDRNKLLHFARQFHQRHWSKHSLSQSMNLNTFTLFSVAQSLSNIVRQLFVLSTTTFYVNKFSTRKQSEEMINKGLKSIGLLEYRLKELLHLIQDFDRKHNIVQADLLQPQTKIKKFKYAFFGFLLSGILYFTIKKKRFA